MTLPASFPLSMSQIATELRTSLPLSLNHPWVIALAGKNALPVSFSDLLGKTGFFNGVTEAFSGSGVTFPNNPPLFGGKLQEIDAFSPSSGNEFVLDFIGSPFWPYNIKVTNQTTGVSVIFNPTVSPNQWVSTPWVIDLVRSSNDTFLIQPA